MQVFWQEEPRRRRIQRSTCTQGLARTGRVNLLGMKQARFCSHLLPSAKPCEPG